METESTHATDSEFAQSPWVDMGGFSPSEQSPTLDYPGFGYGVLPLDASYGVSIPPPYASLPMTMTSNTWPSMLTTQGPFSEAGMPAMPLPPPPPPPPPPPQQQPPPQQSPATVSVTPIQPPRKSSTSGSTPRRTLTDEDRRRMCLYHEENKTAKQTDIGALFGVERSTVSKVLRQKEKYLNPDDGTRSPIKRAKGRVPDIEKALSNWARNYQRQGYPLNDEKIREKALFFASTCGSPDGKEKVLSTSWLEKFKRKYNLMGAKSRKGSLSAKSDSESPTCLSIDSALASAIHSPTILSPTSTTGFLSPSPLSPMQSNENIRAEFTHSLAEMTEDFQHAHSHSTTSLDTSSTFSAGVTSPTSTLVTDSPFTPTSQSLTSPVDGSSNRPRSQTFPLGTADPSLLSLEETEELTKAALRQSILMQEATSMEEQPDQKILPGLDTSVGTIKRNRSNPEIKPKTTYPSPFSKSTNASPVNSPGTPSQDEARKALELVMSYLKQQPAGLVAEDYLTIGKLMEKLELTKPSQGTLPGGLTRIDEHEDVPSLNKKRSIHSMG